MKNFNVLSKMCSQLVGSRSSEVGFDCRLTVGSPSGLDAKWMLKLVSVLVLILTVGVGGAWGAVNDLVYTLSFSQLNSGTNYNSYGGNHTITGANSKSWTVRGNQSAGTWLQVGGNSTSAADVIAIYNSSANITSVDVGKVVVTHSGTGGASLGGGRYASPTIYSVKLEVASNSDFSTITDTKTINNPSTSTDVEFSPTSGAWDKASYYRITYNYKSSNSGKNAYIKVSAVKFYEGASGCSNGTITYSAGSTTNTGGNAISGSHASDTKVCSTNLTLPGATFTTTGYTQDGWATSDGGSKVYNLSATNYSTEGDATLYPHWSANNYTVTWMSNGSQHTTTSVSYGSKPTFPSNPSSCDATSDTFYGWTTAEWTGALDDVSAKTIYTSAASMPNVTETITYYAVFAKASSSSSYKKGTSADLTEGQTVVIVNNNSSRALSSEADEDGYLLATSVSITSNTITSPASALIWTVELGSNDGYYFKHGDNYINAYEDNKGNHHLYFDNYTDEWMLTGSGPYVLNSTEDPGYKLYYWSTYSCWDTYTGTGNPYNTDFYVPEVTYSKYLTNCCTPLASINGSVSWSSGSATVSWDAAGGCSSWGLKYKTHAAEDIPANWTSYAGSFGTATGRTSNSTAISSLTAGTEYDFKITGTSDGSVYCSGTVTETKSSTVPKITASSSMTDLGYQEGETPVAQTFTITGTQLTGNLTVTAPSNFLVSLDGSSWSAAGGSKTVTVSTPPNNLGSTTIHVKANSGLSEGADPSGNITISGGGAASVNVAVSATITEACTAPSSVTITGTTKYFGGQTISLTATPTGGVGEASYQWQKKVSGVWTNVANGGGISGATTNNLQITSCTHGNSGGYRCVVSTGTTCSTKSHADDNAGYGVHVYSIYGRYYNEGEWAHNEIAYTSGTTGTATVHLSAKKTYTFKVRSNNDLYYGNSSGNFIIQPATNMDCGTNNSEIRLFTTIEGDYTITVDIAHGLDNSPYVTIAVSYPSVTHPSTGYVYVQKFNWRPYLHYWYDNSNKLTEWGSDPQLNSDQYTTICGTEYWCVPVIDYYCNFIAKDAAGDPSNTTGDQHTNSPHPGQKLYNDGSWQWAAIPTYTISYAGGTGSTGSMSSESSIIAGSDQTLTAFNTITKAGYTFSCWHANQDVTIGGSTVNEGDDISDGATIQNVCGNLTLTAQWTANTNTAYTVKHYQQNIANDDYTEVTGDRQNLTGTTDASVTPAVKSYTGFTAPSTQTVAILGDGSLVVDYYYTRNSYNLTWNLGGGTTTTAGTGIASGVSVNTTSSVKYGTSLTAPTVTKTGYGFSAWSPSAPAFTMPAAATTYTATWSATNYTITYNLNSGTNPGGAPTGFTIESSEITLPTPTRAGYRFDGWYANVGLTGDVQTTIPAGSTGNKTYWAKWTAKTDTYKTALHTDASGWTAYASGYTTNTSGAGYSIPAGAGNVSKGATSSCEDLHYAFAGWVADEYKASPDGHIITASGTTDATGTTYWAVWGDAVPTTTYSRLTSIAGVDESAQYVLGIDGTGFHYSGTSSWGLTDLPANQTPLYYTLTKEDAATPTYFTAATSISSDTYYLQVTSKGTFNMTTTSGTSAGQLVIGSTTNFGGADKAYAVSVKGGTELSLRKNGASGIRCYDNTTTGSLVFFYKVVTSGDIDYVTSCCELQPATSVVVESTTGTSATLSWTAPSPTTGITKLQVRDASDNSVLVDNLLVSATGATVTGLTECDEYTFYVASVGATCYTASESVDAQPYSGAKTVTYKYHDDVTPDGSFTTDCDNTSTTLPNPSRTGYTLNGWYTASEGGTKKGNGGADYTPDADITLHAQWSIIDYNVTYSAPSNGNYTIQVADGSATSATKTANYNQTITIAATPSSGYRFGSWTITNTSTSADVTSSVSLSSYTSANATFTMPAYGVTITATFIQIHTLTFVVPTGGGSAVTPPATADHGGTVTLPGTTGKDAEFSCETFLGWTTTPPVSGTWASTPSYKAAGATSDAINSNTTFYAVYSRSGAGASGTISFGLTSMKAATNWGQTYGVLKTYTNAGKTWKYNAYTQNGNDFIQLKNEDTIYVKVPDLDANVSKVILHYCQTNSDSRTVYFNNAKNKTNAASYTHTGGSINVWAYDTIDCSSKNWSTGYILASDTYKTDSIIVQYGAPPIVSHALHCDCEVTQFDLTYDANTAYFDGSTISCDGVDDYAWAAHDDIYTICATEPTCEGYKFIGWNTQANGSGEDGRLYQAGEEVTCWPEANMTLYARYERVYTVTFNNQGATTAVTQDSYGAEIAVPSATTPCSSDWAFVGWSETAIAPMSMIPSIEIASGTSTYTPTKDVTLYAIYRKTSESSAFVAGMSGAYKIKATYDAADYYAGTANTALAEETNAANAVAYYIKYTSADGGKYTIQRADAKYITTAEDGTNLSYGDSEHYWTITKVGDLWSVQSIATSRYLRYSNGTGFKAYTTSQDANYVSFVATEGQYYYRTMSCASDYDITFHANGSTINWADGHAEASYKDLVDATVVSTFPTATFDGWTFLGWRRSNYSESTSAPESSTIFGGSDGTSGNMLTISSADEDLYPVFTRFEDNEPFDQVNGGDYFIYFLESGSDDGYGDERRVYAAAYGDSKRYNSSALCSSATEFTFTKLANGNWTIYDKTTNKYLYAEGNDWLKQKTGTSGAEWTLTVNGSAFDAYCVGTDFGQISAYGDGASATFQNYARTNISGGSPNPLYHRVYLGGCSNRTFTTNPSITPEIEIHGQAKVTSTATKSVKARTALTVTASDISTANLTVTSDNSAFKFCLTSNGTYTASVNIPVVSNKVGVTPIYIEYTPTATSDGVEGAIITVSDGAGTPTSVSTVAGDVQGRHLPANFVIAAKLDDRWYALPANCTTSTSSTAGILIEVDDVNDPTTATLAPDYTKYGLREVASTRYAANGANVTFVEKLTTDPAKEYTLYNGSATSVQVNAQWSGYYTTNPERYEWILNSDDFEDYTITSATTLASDAGPRTVSLNTSGVWGTLLNSKSYDGKVRLLPATFYEESPAQIVEWKASAVVVMYTGTETSATTKVGTGDASSSQTLSTRKLTHGVYELSTDAFASNEGKILWLYFGDTKKAFEIPWIISSEVNAATGHDKHDVVILKNGKLTAVSTKYSFRNVYVYGGGKLDISSGSLGVNNIILRAGGITTSGIGSSPSATYEYIYPQVKLGGTLTSTKTNIQYEYITDYEHWFHLCLPFNATLSSITYPQEYYGDNVAANNKGSWLIKRYAGEVRATGSYEAWKDIEKDSPAKTEVTAGFGYIFWGAPKKVTIGGETQRQKWGIQRMTMSITAAAATTAETSNKNISVDSYTGVATSTKPNDQGWNLVGNPYMTNLTGLNSTSLIAGELVHTDTDPWDGKWKNNGDGIRYVTIPDNHFDNYEAKTMDWFTTENPMVAGRTFFVQIAEGESTLTFATANRASLMPALFAKTEQAVDIETGIVMSDESKHDEVNFWIKDGKTAEYEYNADYPKTPNNSHFNLYGVHEHGDLSWIAISPEIAEGSMAIGYQVPTAGEYRLSLSETYVSDKIEQLLVTDHEMSPEITTDLMVEDYIFQVNQAETNNTRFTVSIKIKSGTNTATDIDDIRTDSDHPIKFLYRDKIYILRGGNIYDTTGKQVKGGAQ